MTYNEYVNFIAKEIIEVARDRAEDNEDNFAVVYYDNFDDENGFTENDNFNEDLHNEIAKCKEIIEVEIGGYEYCSVEIVFKEKEGK